ncbi:hypothetical protein EIN_043740 [Entamoeba invadens IP1]|uniref:Uncharacterized protein n=1 Tax=Entamoeba invadens IP1 TaxID=370355 RepID=A0A0A1U527_ENTIV|nr:hypothetical protein EIN_043740 [Entamoeba invadens IP1]ELP86836.1 hypothetical protein EIN_043740 [Entamoeba invadens IP1]|eukprot:XP_004253607.1 hypothetical protein EIN_043740 [Entamoeba invadens IP1]
MPLFPLFLLFSNIKLATCNECYSLDGTGCVFNINSTCSGEFYINDSNCIASRAFYNNKKITSIIFNVTKRVIVGNEAFRSSLLSSFVASNGIKQLGTNSFFGTKITTIDLDGVEDIPLSAFANCKQLQSVLNTPNLKTIGENGFYGTNLLSHITFGNQLTQIGNYAFQSSGLVNVSFDGNVNGTLIGNYAFYNCLNLLTVDITNVTSIGEYAFYDSSNLESLINTESLKTVQTSAFSGCDKLKEIHLGQMVSLGESAFGETLTFIFYHGDEDVRAWVSNSVSAGTTIFVPRSYNDTKFAERSVVKVLCHSHEYIDTTIQYTTNVDESQCKECPEGTGTLDGVNDNCDLDTSYCQRVNPNCKYCDGQICAQCTDNSHITEDTHKCYNISPDGYYLDGDIYKHCDAHCDTCESKGSCTKCSPNYIYIEDTSKCDSECPKGSFVLGNVCKKCMSKCTECVSQDECRTCVDGYYFNGIKCAACKSHCDECYDYDVCALCEDSYYYQEDTEDCVKYCPSNYFIDNLVCRKCNKHCKTCENFYSCEVCEDGFFPKEDDGECVNPCPEKYFLQDKKCLKCQEKYLLPCTDNECKVCVGTKNGALKVSIVLTLMVSVFVL